jgi:predicted naringenin-chalcone synthase
MQAHEGPRRTPLMSVPVVSYPERRIPHDEAIEIVRQQYEPLFNRYPGDQQYQREFTDAARVALKMSRHLSIDSHPVHLPIERIIAPRGLEARNQEAFDAFMTYAPDAASRAISAAGLTPSDIDAVLVETSTVIAMPPVTVHLVEALGLRSDVRMLPFSFLGCNGGAHAISQAFDHMRAHPDHRLLIVAADYASPHYHVEEDLRNEALRGSIIASALFSDATAAAVVSSDLEGPGFEITRTSSICVPGTQDALYWEIKDDGLHFRLTGKAMKIVPDVAPKLGDIMSSQGWRPEDLFACSFHSGGDRIIEDVRQTLGLDAYQVGPTRASLRYGNTMSVAVFAALNHIATSEEYGPEDGDRGIGAGFGPGFCTDGHGWVFRGSRREPLSVG